MAQDDIWGIQNYDIPQMGQFMYAFNKNQEGIDEAMQQMADRKALEDNAHQASIDSLEVLKRIEMNTAYLKDIVDLLNTSNEHQKELNEMIQSILNIAKSPDKSEAQSRYRSVMKKIGDFATVTSSALNIAKLSALAATVLQFFMQSH